MKCLREHAGTSQKTLFKTHQRVVSLSTADRHRRRVFSGSARKTKTQACLWIHMDFYSCSNWTVQFKTRVSFFGGVYERMFTPAGKLCSLTALNSTLKQSYLITHSSWSPQPSKYSPSPYKTTCYHAPEVLSSGDVMTPRACPAADGLSENTALRWSLWMATVNIDVWQHGNVSLMEPPCKKKKKIQKKDGYRQDKTIFAKLSTNAFVLFSAF